MSYEHTEVPVAKSQEQIRKLIGSHQGFGTAFISERDPNGTFAQEGFQAKVLIEKKPYTIKIMAVVKQAPKVSTESQKQKFSEQQERRIWRVLYYHLKSVFEASDSGVMEFRELMLPYLVTGSGQTIAEKILPRIDEAVAITNGRLLAESSEVSQ